MTVREGLRNRKPNKYLLDIGIQVTLRLGHYDEAAGYLDELKRLGEDADYHHRAAMLCAALGDFVEALTHADTAARASRPRFEVLANRAHILVELDDFEEAEKELDALDARFRLGLEEADVRFGLRCKLLIRQGKWRPAEDVLERLSDKSTPYYKALRLDVLRKKRVDPSISPGERESALAECERLEREPIPAKLLLAEAGEIDMEESDTSQDR